MGNLILSLNKYVMMLDADCEGILGPELMGILQEVFTIIRIAVPVLVVVLISVDMLSAVTSGDEKGVKEAQSRAIKRVIIGVVIFFIPTLVNFVLKMAGYVSGTCGIIG